MSEISSLTRALTEGRITRRTFIGQAALLGLVDVLDRSPGRGVYTFQLIGDWPEGEDADRSRHRHR